MFVRHLQKKLPSGADLLVDVAFAHAENVDAVATIEEGEETDGLFSRRIERRMLSLYSDEDVTMMHGAGVSMADSIDARG